jgi:hypothetical protein
MLWSWLFSAELQNPDGPTTRNRRATPSPSDIAEVVSAKLDPAGRFTVRKRAVVVSAHGTDPWECSLDGVLVLPAGIRLQALQATTSAGRTVVVEFEGPVSAERVESALRGDL